MDAVRTTGQEARQTTGPRGSVAHGLATVVPVAASVIAMALVSFNLGLTAVEMSGTRDATESRQEKRGGSDLTERAARETVISGYLGAPYTYPSQVTVENPAEKTDLTVPRVAWDAKPFKSPIYYGVRIARWGATTGGMVDFTHSKTISRPDDVVAMKGLIAGVRAPEKARIGDIFKHLEFSHGHNMLTLNGLLRIGAISPSLSPYVGVGAGISLPHSEVQFRTAETSRTYEYQYAGPVAQALLGLEFKLPSSSIFVEYKFTFADYRAPLTRRDGDILFTDLWARFREWWAGIVPAGGFISTRLVSHQAIGGAGVRIASP